LLAKRSDSRTLASRSWVKRRMLSSLKKGLEQQAADLSHIEKMLTATQPVKRPKKPKSKISK